MSKSKKNPIHWRNKITGMPLGPVLAGIGSALAPIGGAIGSAALQRSWALKDWERVNEYNSPKNQVARAREAGLPLASMFSGSGGSTSSAPNATNVDPTLGTAQGLQASALNRMQRKQLQLMDEQIGKAEADKIVAQVAANKALDEDKFYHSNKGSYDPVTGLTTIVEGNRRQDSLALSMQQQQAETETKDIALGLKRIEYKVQQELEGDGTLSATTRQQLENLITHNIIVQKNIEGLENQLKFARAIIADIENSPSGMTGWKAIIYKGISSILKF